MPPPVLELTQQMVGPGRTDLTRAYLIAEMQWPEDPAARSDVMQTAHALQMGETLRNVPAAREALAVLAWEASIKAKTPEDIRRAGAELAGIPGELSGISAESQQGGPAQLIGNSEQLPLAQLAGNPGELTGISGESSTSKKPTNWTSRKCNRCPIAAAARP